MTNGGLMKVESIAECSKESILQYFWPALSDNWSLKFFLDFWEWPFYTGFTVYMQGLQRVSHGHNGEVCC